MVKEVKDKHDCLIATATAYVTVIIKITKVY